MERQAKSFQRKLARSDRHRRRGVVLVATLVCLLIVTSILGSMLQGVLQAQRQSHVERNLRQTELLLQAGTDRAAFQLARNAEYSGERWTLPAKAIIGNDPGEVTIKVSRDRVKDAWKVDVVAEYPLGSERSIRRSQQIFIPFQEPQKQE